MGTPTRVNGSRDIRCTGIKPKEGILCTRLLLRFIPPDELEVKCDRCGTVHRIKLSQLNEAKKEVDKEEGRWEYNAAGLQAVGLQGKVAQQQ